MKIELEKFDLDFLASILGHEEIVIRDDGVYYVFTADGQKAGVVGFLPFEKDAGFVQVAVSPDFRGKGLVKLAEEELARKHDLKILYATINQDNKNSIRAHINAGFEPEDIERMQFLRSRGLLKSSEVRLRKDFINSHG